MKILVAAEFSGVVREAFAALGHDAWSCDLLPSERPGKHIQADFRLVVQDSWDFIGYHYECRVMANSGVRWLYQGERVRASVLGRSMLFEKRIRNEARWQELQEAAEIFNLTIRDTRPGYAENSIMHCHAKRLIDREQDQVIQPWHHGEPYFKATCLWLRGIPPLRETNRLTPPAKGTPEHKAWSAVHRASPGPDRWKERSRTLEGVARAFAMQWGS